MGNFCYNSKVQRHIGMSSNGRTAAFGAVYSGSNPGVPALRRAQCRHYCDQFMQWFVYMLLCDQKTFYIGFTADIVNRLMQHCRGQSFFTKQFSEIKLIYCEKYLNEKDAVKREKQLKGWSHAKKQKLLTSIDEYIIQTLNLEQQEANYERCFIVQKDELEGILSPHFFISKPLLTKQN